MDDNKENSSSHEENAGDFEPMLPADKQKHTRNSGASDSETSQTVSTEHLVVTVETSEPTGERQPIVTVVDENGEIQEATIPGSTSNMADGDAIEMTSFKDDGKNYGSTNNSYDANEKVSLASRNVSIIGPRDDPRLDNLDIVSVGLHEIAKNGDVEYMGLVLSRMSQPQLKKRISKRDKERHTPLHYAARYNHLEMCKILFRHGADIHARGEDDATPLHLVAKFKPKLRSEKLEAISENDNEGNKQEKANLSVLKFLVDSGAHINQKDFYGLSAMHHACLRGNEQVVKLLLDCPGIAIEAVDKQLMTPLHIAAVYGHERIAGMLVDKGASIRCKDEENGTPLHLACSEGNANITKLIIERGKAMKAVFEHIITDTDNDGNTPLHLAVDSGHMEVVNLLLDQYKELDIITKLNMRRTNDETPLHLAASQGHIFISKVLVTSGARINSRDGDSSTPLIVASKFNHHKTVDYFLQCGAKLEVEDVDGYTALLIAANYGHPETIALLVQFGANLAAMDKNDRSAIHQCAMEDRVDALKQLMEHDKAQEMLDVPDKYGNTPLHIAAENGNLGIVQVLLEHGCHIDLKNDDEQTPLHLAASNGRVKVLELLVKKEKNMLNDDDEDANTALHLAALAGREVCVQKLVDLGANISARNAKQWTPLDCCASAGHNKCAVVLLEADAPVDPKDKRKITPMHLACKQGHLEMVKVLLKWNADVSMRSSEGRNALDFAIDHGQEECALLIIKSDQWRDALRNRTKDQGTNTWTVTPMRKLIKKMPYVAEEVFKRCSEDNGKHPDRQDYMITFDYEFLDDEYACTHWVDISDNSSEISFSVSSDSQGEVYDDQGRVIDGNIPYNKNTAILLENHPLYLMAHSKRENLLKHPLVLSLMNYKWKSYGRTLYYVNLMIYAFFLAVLNSYMLIMPPPYALNSTSTTSTCAVVVSEAVGNWGSGCVTDHRSWQQVSTYILYVVGGFNLLKEIFQILTHRHVYFLSMTNLIELAVFVLTILLVIDFTDFSANTGIRESWQWQCGAAAVFFSWFGLVLFIQNFPRFGIYVLMFSHILKTFTQFIAVFLLFIFAFSFSFHALLQNRFAFDHWWNSLIKTIVMMIGEFEYDTLFDEEETSNSYTSAVYYDALTYLLFVVFVIIMSILLMNLMVGLAVDDIKEVQQRAELVRLGMQVNLALDVEYTMPTFIRRKYMRKSQVLLPNQYRYKSKLVRLLLQDNNLSHDKVHAALNPETTDIDDIYEKVEGLEENVQKLRFKLRDVHNRTKNLENMLKAIVDFMEVPFDTNDEEGENS